MTEENEWLETRGVWREEMGGGKKRAEKEGLTGGRGWLEGKDKLEKRVVGRK